MSPRQYLNNRDFRRWGSAYRRSCEQRWRERIKSSETGLFHFSNISANSSISPSSNRSCRCGMVRQRDVYKSEPDAPYHSQASKKAFWLACVAVRSVLTTKTSWSGNFAVTDDTVTARLRQCWRHRQPRAVVRERPPPDPTISASAILVAQGVPESLPIYFRDLHIVRALADLLIHFGHFLKYLRLSPRIERRRS